LPLPPTENDPSDQNPLAALVNQDVPRRLVLAQEEEAGPGLGGALRASGFSDGRPGIMERWQSEPLTANAPADASLAGVSDVRVAPWCTQMEQTTEGATLATDYYTPPGSPNTGSNYPCGLYSHGHGQIMRYFQWPTAGVGTASFAITVNGISQIRPFEAGMGWGGL